MLTDYFCNCFTTLHDGASIILQGQFQIFLCCAQIAETEPTVRASSHHLEVYGHAVFPKVGNKPAHIRYQDIVAAH